MVEEDNYLEVMLTEYKELRDELKTKFVNQITIFGLIVSSLGVSYSIIFQYEYAKDIVILIPFITICLGLRAQYSNYGVKLISEYVRALEDRIFNYLYPVLDEKKIKSELLWVGWGHYWKKRKRQSIVLINDALPKLLIYFLIPYLIAVLDMYCYGIQNECFRNILGSIGIDNGIFRIIYAIVLPVTCSIYWLYQREGKIDVEYVIKEIFNEKLRGEK